MEKAIDYFTQSWWRTARVHSPAEAQASADRFCVEVADERRRGELTVAELADREPLLELPAAPFPAELRVVRTVAANALVSLWGNRYSAPPGLVGADRIMFETDIPHPTCLFPHSVERVRAAIADLDPSVQRRILQDNAADLYKIHV